MKITVLNGSPEGKYSITLQSVLYLQKNFPEDEFEFVEIATRIKSLEKDLTPAVEAMQSADLVLFSYPVYTLLAPSQLHLFISLLKEKGLDFSGKSAAQISTSKHFYDMTAHKYIELNAKDLGFTYLKGLSADMDDLLSEKGQQEVLSFWRFILFLYDQHTTRANAVDQAEVPTERLINIITDAKDDPELEASIARFQALCPMKTRVVNIHELHIKGGCLGCFKCAADGTCVYKDGFPDFFRSEIITGAAIIYAFRIQDHSMGPTFKVYDDRQFCNGHRMTTMGMPVGYIVKGDLPGEPLVQTLIDAKADVGQNILCGVVNVNIIGTGPGEEEEKREMEGLIGRLQFALADGTRRPQSFWGIGGMKIFRDLIWTMRGLMKADHKFYKEHGVYDDFPQRHIGRMLQMKLIGWMANNKKMQKKMGNAMNEGKLMPYKKILEQN